MKTNTWIRNLRPLALVLLVASTIFLSCEKDADEPDVPTLDTKYPIAGLWIGTFTQDQGSNSNSYAYTFAISPDGTMMTKSATDNMGAQYSTGNWSLSNDSLFSASITTLNATASPVTQTLSAVYSSKGTLSGGVWANTTPVNGINFTGKFSHNRVN